MAMARPLGVKGAKARVATTKNEPETKCKVFLRFYGRWDNEDQWVLLQSLPLQGVAGTVVPWFICSDKIHGSAFQNTGNKLENTRKLF